LIWFFGLGLSALIYSPWPQGGFKVEGLILSGLFYLIARTSLFDLDKFPKYALIIVLPAIVQAAIGISQYLNLFPPTSNYFLSYESQVIGTVGGANVLGAFLSGSLPFIYYFIQRSKGRIRIGWILSLLLIVIALILTKSRGAWVAAIVGISVYNWEAILQLLKPLISRNTMLALLVSVIAGIAALFLIGIYKLNPASASGRLYIWSISWDMFKDHIWTGVGFGNFGLNWLEYQGNYFANHSGDSYKLAVNLASAHCQYLHILTETGFFGLGIFLTFVLSIFNSVKRALRSLDHRNKQILITLVAALVTLFTHALIDDVLNPLIIKLQFLVILALTVSMINTQGNSHRENAKEPRKWLSLALLILIIPLTLWSWHKFKGETLWKQGHSLALAGNWSACIEKYEEARIHLPHSDRLDFYLGAAYSKTGEAKKAIELLKKSMEGFSDKNQYITLGKAYIDNGGYILAEANLRQVLQYYPGLLYPHYLLSQIHYENGDLIGAMSELQIIIDAEENPLNSSAIERVKQDAEDAMNILNGLNSNNH